MRASVQNRRLSPLIRRHRPRIEAHHPHLEVLPVIGPQDPYGDRGGLIQREPKDPGTDRGDGEAPDAVLRRHPGYASVAALQDGGLAAVAAKLAWPDRMDHEPRLQPESGRDHRVPRWAPADRPACDLEPGARRCVDGAAHAAARPLHLAGGVQDCVYLLGGDVAPDCSDQFQPPVPPEPSPDPTLLHWIARSSVSPGGKSGASLPQEGPDLPAKRLPSRHLNPFPHRLEPARRRGVLGRTSRRTLERNEAGGPASQLADFLFRVVWGAAHPLIPHSPSRDQSSCPRRTSAWPRSR